MVTALQQVVQHLVLHQLAVVAPAVREVDSVRGLPPSVAAALVGRAGIIRARYLVPFHAIELGPETGALLYRGPPRLVRGGGRELDGARGGEAVEAAEQQRQREPGCPPLHRVRVTVPRPLWPPGRTPPPRS